MVTCSRDADIEFMELEHHAHVMVDVGPLSRSSLSIRILIRLDSS